MKEKAIGFKSREKEVSKMKVRVLLVMVMAIALLAAGVTLASITNTKHNLSATGPGTIKASSGQQNNEICIWCHTPHHANTALQPLWNKATPTANYTMYGNTIAGTAPATSPQGVTRACLSCHDGVSGINSLINQAGAGGLNATGTPVAFGNTAAGTNVVLTGVANIGTTLANDHPVSIDYTAGRASLKATSTTINWIGANTIGALLRSGRVECSSCHEPHSNVNTLFLRTSNSGSALCLGCHAK